MGSLEDFLRDYTQNDPTGGRLLKVTIKIILDSFPMVSTYADLPDPTTVPGQVYIVGTSTGTKWVPNWIGGSYYPKGFYRSNGTSWDYIGDFPNQASQEQVDAGTLDDVFVSPLTLKNSRWVGLGYRQVSSDTTVQVSDGTIDCSASLIVTIPLLSSITDYVSRTINNSGSGTVTIVTSGGELLYDVTSFALYGGESLTFQKGNGKWIVK